MWNNKNLFTFLYFIRGTTQFSSAVLRNVNFERIGNPPKKVNICFQSNNNLIDSKKTFNGIVRCDSSFGEYECRLGSVDKIISPRSEKVKIEDHIIEPYKLEKRKVLDDDILDVLEYQEGIFLDVRTLCELLCHFIKEKMVIISSFCTISEYESYPIQIMYLLLSLAILLFINAFLFFEKYLSKRYKTMGELGIVYLLEYEIEKSAICGAVSSFLLYIITLFFSTRKKIKYLKYSQKIRENFLIEAEKLITSYKKKNIISIIVCFVLMLIILFYLTVFIEVYPKIFIILIESFFISIPFCMLFQTVICLFIAGLRTIGKSWYLPCVYKLSKLLI